MSQQICLNFSTKFSFNVQIIKILKHITFLYLCHKKTWMIHTKINLSTGFPTRPATDTKRFVQPQKMARGIIRARTIFVASKTYYAKTQVFSLSGISCLVTCVVTVTEPGIYYNICYLGQFDYLLTIYSPC